MTASEPGHIPDPGPRRPRGPVLVASACVLAAIGAVLAFLPIGSYVAGVPALAAIVLAIIVVVVSGRRLVPAIVVLVSVAAVAVASVVSIAQFSAAASRFAAGLGDLDDLPRSPPPGSPTPEPTAEPGAPDGDAGVLASGRHRVIYEVLGEGSARVTYSAFLGGRVGTSREDSVDVPHRRTQRVTVDTGGTPGRFSMIVSPGAADEDQLGCRITIDDRVVAERPAAEERSSPVVVCTATASD